MRVMLTGATGFIGGEVARQLRARGDDVVALVRTPAKAQQLADAGVELVAGDLGDSAALDKACDKADAVVHGAAVFAVGVPEPEHEAMRETNVGGTTHVFEAARRAGVGKVVYISTVAAFGNTHDAMVDETYHHPHDSFCSAYEQTKTEAHDVAMRFAAEGLPVVVVQPGGVYGPGDPSQFGDLLRRFLAGKMPAVALGGLGMTMVHRDDVAAGVLLALDRGVPGECYVLTGEAVRVSGLIGRLAKVAGRRPPRFTIPTSMIRLLGHTPLRAAVGLPRNVDELISSSEGVTYWARADKAQRELGWRPRPLDEGLQELVDEHRGA